MIHLPKLTRPSKNRVLYTKQNRMQRETTTKMKTRPETEMTKLRKKMAKKKKERKRRRVIGSGSITRLKVMTPPKETWKMTMRKARRQNSFF